MLLTPTVLIVNGALLLFVITITAIMLSAGGKHDYNYGIGEIQEPLRKRIILIIFLLLFTGLGAAIFNIYMALYT